MRTFVVLLSLGLLGLTARSESLLCAELFNKTYAVNEFIISIAGKKQSEEFLVRAHKNLTDNFEPETLQKTLKLIKKSGLSELTSEQKDFIIKFRQNTSFLRSIFNSLDSEHESPTDFSDFVRDFGVLKDYLLMEDTEGAQHSAKKILRKYSDLDFNLLLVDSSPASKKSVKKYFKKILTETDSIMNLQALTVDQIHQVRKNLRDVLRYLQIQDEESQAIHSESEQIQFLKKINSKLGEVCDANAAEILSGRLSENSVMEFPIKIRPRVEYFLRNYQIIIED